MIEIDTKSILQADAKCIAMTFLEAVKAYYSDQQNMKKFEAWKASRKQQ